jgi:threonine dehydrogenase-like Zn-dependent dehydrogenase
MRPGGYVINVGVPIGVRLDGAKLFFTRLHRHGGPAPVRRQLPHLIERIDSSRKIDPGRLFDLTLPIDRVSDGYRAINQRRAIKVLWRV